MAVDVFDTKLNDYLNQVEQESTNIKDILKSGENGDIRTAQINRMLETVDKVQQILSVMKRLNFKDEATSEEVRRRLNSILQKAVELSKEQEGMNAELHSNFG